MITLKKSEEIASMKLGGKKLRAVVKELRPMIQAGISTKEIDEEAERLILKQGGKSSFKRVKGYHWSTCLPINDEIVHTPPSERRLKSGDILTLDIGMYYKGFHTDFADMYAVGTIDAKTKHFLAVGQETLYKAIQKVVKGGKLGAVSSTIETMITGNGYHIVKELTGHGVGKELHEDPSIPGFLDVPMEKTPTIQEGLVVAVEVIYTMGEGKMMHDENEEWSIKTSDASLSACFEHTVAVEENKTSILT